MSTQRNTEVQWAQPTTLIYVEGVLIGCVGSQDFGPHEIRCGKCDHSDSPQCPFNRNVRGEDIGFVHRAMKPREMFASPSPEDILEETHRLIPGLRRIG